MRGVVASLGGLDDVGRAASDGRGSGVAVLVIAVARRNRRLGLWRGMDLDEMLAGHKMGCRTGETAAG